MKELKREWTMCIVTTAVNTEIELRNSVTGEVRRELIDNERLAARLLSRKANFKDCFIVTDAAKAKDVSLDVWRYLRDHPEIKEKHHLPAALFAKIRRHKHYCPLCTLFKEKGPLGCEGCPLVIEGKTCTNGTHPYSRWTSPRTSPGTKEQRYEAAAEIVKLIEAWEV